MTGDPAPGTGSAAPPGPREWLALAVLTLPVALLGIDMSVLHFAVPTLSADLAPTAPELLWIVDIYGFMIVGFLITMGTLGDRIGRRRLLLVGAVAFGAASLLAAFSTSPEMLIVARALLGAAGATLMPSTLSLLRVVFTDARHRAVAIGFWTAGFMGGSSLGPVVGGALLDHFWWGSVFLLGVPVMLQLLVLGPVVLPEYRSPGAERIDLTSAALLLVAMLAIVYGIKEIAAGGGVLVPALVCGAGVAVAVVFLRRQRVLPTPFLDLGLFRSRSFSTSLVVVLLSAVVFAGLQFLVAQFLQTVLGLPPLQAGLWTLPATTANIAAILVTPLLLRRIPPAVLVPGAVLVMAAGTGVLALAGPGYDLATVVVGFAVTSAGLGPIMALSAHLATSTAPPDRTGAAAGVMETTSELGIALGITTIGSLAAAVYRRHLGPLPAQLPPDAAAAAGGTVAGAGAAAEQLDPAAGRNLVDAAHLAFSQGMTVSAAIGTALLAVVAAGAFAVLRRAEPPDVPAAR